MPRNLPLVHAARKGFTLLELIVVLLILGILAAIAIPTYNIVQANAVTRSVETTAQAIVRNANAMASSDGSGGIVTDVHLWAAGAEAFGFNPDAYTPAVLSITAGAPWAWSSRCPSSVPCTTEIPQSGDPAGYIHVSAATPFLPEDVFTVSMTNGTHSSCVVITTDGTGPASITPLNEAKDCENTFDTDADGAITGADQIGRF